MMQQNISYLERFIDALRFLAELHAEYRPDFDEVRKTLLSYQSNELRSHYLALVDKFIKPFAGSYVARLDASTQVAHSCHGVSQGFFETWCTLEIAQAFPLSLTVGNVYYKDENIYGVSKSLIQQVLNEGFQPNKKLGVHVWLTLDNMTVIDLTILSSLALMGKYPTFNGKATPVLIWLEDNPGDFHFEPILVDNNFFTKVDTGKVVYSHV
jgi:hypothetical protein